MAHPRKPLNKKCRTTGISLPPTLLQQARKLAISRDMSLSKLIRNMLADQLSEATR
jgi:hypothetical protein